MSIGLDIDGVLIAERWREFFRYVKIVEELDCSMDDYLNTNNWELATRKTNPEVTKLYRRFRKSDLYTPTKAVPGAIDALRILHPLRPLHLVTSRPEDIKQPTLDELLALYPDVIFQGHHFGGAERKFELVETHQIAIHIEDNVRWAIQVAEQTKARVIIFPHAANQRLMNKPHPRLIYPKTAWEMAKDMTDQEWENHARQTWAEIPDLVHTLMEERTPQIQRA